MRQTEFRISKVRKINRLLFIYENFDTCSMILKFQSSLQRNFEAS